jgi:hypothetical protein
MSLNTFNKRARINVSLLISGTGQFSPFVGEENVPVDWTIEGTVRQGEFVEELTVKEETCGVPLGSEKMFRSFGIFPGSTGNTSGSIPTGQLPVIPLSLLNFENRGSWIVNTSPVLSPNGYANDAQVVNGYYVVAQPEDAGIDDPIEIDPPIDGLSRVYPGDHVVTTGTGAGLEWGVAPQQRFPKPDRTYFWTPNSAPHLESGGIADGELVLPGTVMIPTSDFFIENSADYIDGIFAFIAGSGVMFNGQNWTSLVFPPYVYEPPDEPRELWFGNLSYGGTGRYDSLFESQHRQKPFVFANIPVDDSSTPTYDYTFEGQSQESEGLVFRWLVPGNGVANNMIPAVSSIYDFGDAWSRFHKNTRDWLAQRFVGINGAGFTLSTTGEGGQDIKTIVLGVDEFVNGNQTVIQQTYTDPEGTTLTNSFTLTLSVVVSIA